MLTVDKLEEIQLETTGTPVAEIVSYLQENLGQKITAYISGLNEPKEVGKWIRHVVKPRFLAEMRLRYAYQATRMIVEAYGKDTAKSWFFGTNTRLNDEAPAYILRHANSIEDLRDIIPVSRAFAGSVD